MTTPLQRDLPKVRKPRYTLDELLKGYDVETPLSDEERAWMDAGPIGLECHEDREDDFRHP